MEANIIQAPRILPAAQEVPSQAPLCRLSEWIRSHESVLGLGLWHRDRDGCAKCAQDELVWNATAAVWKHEGRLGGVYIAWHGDPRYPLILHRTTTTLIM